MKAKKSIWPYAPYYGMWLETLTCPDCETTGRWYDMNPLGPCPECGSCKGKRTGTGRFLTEKRRVGWFRWKTFGWWELKSDKPLDPRDDINSDQYDPLRKLKEVEQ